MTIKKRSKAGNRAVPGYEGLYSVSEDGNVWSIASNKYRKLCKDVYGYLQVDLSKDGKRSMKKVHRLVMEAYIGSSDLVINHKNGNKLDNNLSNLEYCTVSYNNKHAYATGLKVSPTGSSHHMFGRRGDKCPNHKLSNTKKKEIKERYRRGGISQRALAKEYGVSQNPIADAIHGDY